MEEKNCGGKTSPSRGAHRSTTLRCFSPEVILVTFLVETGLALYAWWKYRSTRFGKLSAAFLFCLAAFQLGELMVCRGAGVDFWPRFGFIATAFLPVFGIQMAGELWKKTVSAWPWYIVAVGFSVVFALRENLFHAAECTGKFVLFTDMAVNLGNAYVVYYAVALLYGMMIVLRALREKKASKKEENTRLALIWLFVSYLSIIIPSATLYIMSWVRGEGFASVFCGFAIFIAFIMVLRVLPLQAKASK